MVAVEDSPVKGNPADDVVLHGWPTMHNTVSSLSSYVGKVEAFMRMNDIPYSVSFITGGLGGSPKGTAPYIKHGDVLLADSTFIEEYLTNTYADKIKVKPNQDPMLDGVAVAVQRLCEEHLYYSVLWSRWALPNGWKVINDIFFKSIFFPLSRIIPRKVRQATMNKIHSQGFGRHSEKDILTLTDRSLSALSNIIGNKKFITGDEPCPQDAVVFSTLDNILYTNIEGDPVKALAEKYSNLTTYLVNFKETYFPDDNPSKFLVKKDSSGESN